LIFPVFLLSLPFLSLLSLRLHVTSTVKAIWSATLVLGVGIGGCQLQPGDF
jgi:hypothetical protein